MSEGNVAILNTKLDILIEDFKSFKQYTLGFVMAIAVPFGVYVALSIMDTKMDVAILKEKANIYAVESNKEDK